MTSELFNKLYKQLNPAQKKAVDTIDGPVMVIAGPGTGKTQILTLRIANILIKTDINPENVLALTFTESAVFQMRKRLVDIMGTPGFRVEVSTFHGFCNDVIKNNPENFPHLISSNAATDLEQIQIMEQILENTKLELLRPFGDLLYYLKPALSAINDLKKEGIIPQEFEKSLNLQQIDFEKIEDLYYDKGAHTGKMKGKYQDIQRQLNKNLELLIVYKKYQQSLVSKKLYDFNDMLLEVIEMIQKDEQLLLRLQEKYQYILVDEHQDTNAAQNKIVELMASFYESPNLFVVGDEKQAIYRFQGASLENFLYFKTLYPEAILINLDQNYRSTQTVLDASTSMISKGSTPSLFPESLNLKSQNKYNEEQIRIVEINDYHGEYLFLVKDIQDKINSGVLPEEISVLSRNNKDLIPLVECLEEKQIPLVLESEQDVLSDPYIKKLILLFQTIEDIQSDSKLFKAMHIDFLQIEPLDIYKIIKYSSKESLSICEVLEDEKLSENLNIKSQKQIEDFYKKLIKWHKDQYNVQFNHLFTEVLKKSGLLEQVMKSSNSVETLDKFATLYEQIKLQMEKSSQFDLKQFLIYLDLLQTHQISIKKGIKTNFKKAVRLMTAHRSKGLEFDYIYIINSFDGHWGNSRKRSQYFHLPWDYLGIKLVPLEQGDLNDDERRLFYVALTRAKKGVTISYSTCSLEGKEQSPAQFVSEIEESFKIKVDTKDFEQELASDKSKIFISKLDYSSAELEKQFLEKKDFFAEIFYRQGLSATGLNNFLLCPWRFIFRNLLQIPDVKTKSMVFGSGVHVALSKYLKSDKRNIETLINEYQNYLNSQGLSKSDKEELIQKGQKILPLYFDQVVKKWNGQMKSEMSIRGVKLDGEIVLNGIMDLVETTSKSLEVIVHDFKTGRPRSRKEIEGLTASADGNYLRQLVFYKLLLEKYQNGKMKMIQGVLDFIEPDKSGKFHQEVFDITDTQVKELEEMIQVVSKQIIGLTFWNDRCGDKECEYCQLRDYIGK